MTLAQTILFLVTLQRLSELMLARRNTKKLLARGAIEIGAAHYRWVVALHASWLITLWIFGSHRQVNVVLLAIFVMVQGVRAWTLTTLGSRWTTRIIVLPGEPLVTGGPYRYFSHPNYVVVAAEIMLLPLVLNLVLLALVFTLLNAFVLAVRMRAETRALATYSQALRIAR